MEVRLTALLLGELSAEEAAAIRQAMEQNVELATLYERLKRTIDLVAEAATDPTAQTTAQHSTLRLSDARRKNLVQHFKTVTPKEFNRPDHRQKAWYIPLSLAAALVALIGSVALLPGFSNQFHRFKAPMASRNSESEMAKATVSDVEMADEQLTKDDGTASQDRRDVARVLVSKKELKEPSIREPGLGLGGGAGFAFQKGDPSKRTEGFGGEKPLVNFSYPAIKTGTLFALPAREIARGEGERLPESDKQNGASSFLSNSPSALDRPIPTAPTDSLAAVAVSAPPQTTLAPDANILLGGNGANRKGLVLPAAGQKGPTSVAVLPLSGSAELGKKKVLNVEESIAGDRGSIAAFAVNGTTYIQTATATSESEVVNRVDDVAYGLTLPRPGMTELSSDLKRTSGAETLSKSGNVAFGRGTVAANDRDELLRQTPQNVELLFENRLLGLERRLARGLGEQQPQDTHADYKALEPQAQSSVRDRLDLPLPAQPPPLAPTQNAASRFIETPAPTTPPPQEMPAFKMDPKLMERYGLTRGAAGPSDEANQKLSKFKTQGLGETDKSLNDEFALARLNTLDDSISQKVAVVPGQEAKRPPVALSIALPAVSSSAGEEGTHHVEPATRRLSGTRKDASGKEAASNAEKAGLMETEKKITRAPTRPELFQEESQIKLSDLTPSKPASVAPVPQPEVQTRDSALSTFSLNVSDVSFKLAAASLEHGIMPEPAAVRSEEFINAFDYRDSEPPSGVPVAFAWERARYAFAHNRDMLRFSVKTAAQGRQPNRPLNLVLLLDNSGSMERADRVRIVREALRVLATQLQPQDKLSVIAFARTARLWVDGIVGNQAGQISEQLGNLTPQGGTNLEEAMNAGYQTALRHYVNGGVNRVVLLTDGAANLGNVSPDALKQKVEEHRKQGIALDCFGIGWEGLNDDLLEVLSRNGDGRYGFVNTPEEASTEFAGQLAGALRVAASDVKVQVEFNPRRVAAYRQVGYAKHQLTKEQFRDNTVDAAEIGAAESGNALYVVEVNPRGEGPIAIVRVRYKLPGTAEYREHEWAVPFAGDALPLEQASSAMRLAATASAFSEWLVSSPYAGEVTPDRLLAYLSGVPDVYGADARPKKLEWMIRQAKSIAGR